MKEKTKVKAQKRFGCTPKPFPALDLPTYRDICQYSYFIELGAVSTRGNRLEKTERITGDLINLWSKINPGLVLKSKKDIKKKIVSFIDKVQSINRKKLVIS